MQVWKKASKPAQKKGTKKHSPKDSQINIILEEGWTQIAAQAAHQINTLRIITKNLDILNLTQPKYAHLYRSM